MVDISVPTRSASKPRLCPIDCDQWTVCNHLCRLAQYGLLPREEAEAFVKEVAAARAAGRSAK